MNWLGWATIVGLADVVYHMGYRTAVGKFSGLLYIFILNLVICLLCLVGLAYQKWGRGEAVVFQPQSLWLPIVLGVVVCLMEFAIFMTYAKGAPFTLANPFMGAMIALGTLLVAWFFYGERLDWLSYVGLVLILTGSLILAYKFAD